VSFSESIHTIKTNSVRNRRRGLSAMTKIAIPPDLAGMFATCEHAYEQAAREGYAENPAAVAALKSAWTALHLANNNYATAKGVFSVEFAAIRVDRACRASREACIKTPRGNKGGSGGAMLDNG
jgi:hypothetical protein